MSGMIGPVYSYKFQMRLYMYTTGDSCVGPIISLNSGSRSYACTMRFFGNWTGGYVYETTFNENPDTFWPGTILYIIYT